MATTAHSSTTPEPERTKGKAKKKTRWWWHIHQWVGLKLAIFMSFIFATGTLAVLSPEIDWLIQPSLRVWPSTVEGPVQWERIAARAAAYPGTARIRSIAAPETSAFAAIVVTDTNEGQYAILHAHPTTGEIQGAGPWAGAERILRNMHRHLNLPTKYGVPIVCILGVLLLVSFVSSLFVYKKWWRGFLKPIRWRDARTAWGDFHRLAGIWSLWFVLLISLTGIWYLVESLGLDAPEQRAGRSSVAVPASELPGRLSANLESARRAFPDLRLQGILFPPNDRGPFEFMGQYEAILVRDRANAVATDPATAQVLQIRDGRELDAHQRISEMADPLHFGEFGGYWTKIPWFLFGLLLTGLSVSGVVIYGLRISRPWKIRKPLKAAWQGMTWWRWLALAGVVTGIVMLPSVITQKPPAAKAERPAPTGNSAG